MAFWSKDKDKEPETPEPEEYNFDFSVLWQDEEQSSLLQYLPIVNINDNFTVHSY